MAKDDNDQFGTKQSGEKDTTARMGLANFFGANEPKFGTLPAPLVPMPALIRQAISAAVLLRKVPNSRWMYNDASLKAKNVMAILRNTTAFTAGNSWVSVAKGVTVITYIIDAVPLTPTVNGQICVKVRYLAVILLSVFLTVAHTLTEKLDPRLRRLQQLDRSTCPRTEQIRMQSRRRPPASRCPRGPKGG